MRRSSPIAARPVTPAPTAAIPTVAALRQRTPEAILDALTPASMRQQGAEPDDAERRAVAEFLGTALTAAVDPQVAAQCTTAARIRAVRSRAGAAWRSWSPDQPTLAFSRPPRRPDDGAGSRQAQAEMGASDFRTRHSRAARRPSAGGRVFVGSQTAPCTRSTRKTGCTHLDASRRRPACGPQS